MTSEDIPGGTPITVCGELAMRERTVLASVENIRALHGIIMGLAITNTLRMFATQQISQLDQNGVQHIFAGSREKWFDCVICLLFITRFYLGDSRYLRTYKKENYHPSIVPFVFDALNIILNSFILAYLSFFVTHTSVMFMLLFLLLLLEVIWWILRRFGSPRLKAGSFDISFLISTGTLIALTIIAGFNNLWNMGFVQAFTTPSAENGLRITLMVNIGLDIVARGPYYVGLKGFSTIMFGRDNEY